MKLRRINNENGKTVIAVQYNDSWFNLATLPGLENSGGDMIKILDNWQQLKPSIVHALENSSKCVPLPNEIKPSLPFQPSSFRDFMLAEKHAIDAARGLVKRFMPNYFPLVNICEKLTKKPFPAFKPKPIWYQQPLYYMGNHLNFVTDFAEIECPGYSQALDYELELGFVITKPLKNASQQQALAAIGGFVVINDFSARDVQLAEMRSGFGPQKAKHFLNGMSSVIVTADDILPYAEDLQAEVRINGNCVARCGTQGMQHSIAKVLMHVSRDEQLHSGELFGMGTMPGGCGMENGHWLKSGDRLELWIDRIGSLTNLIK